MPKSKKNRVVPLTKTTKKGKQQKEKLVQELRDACDTYSHIYVFSVDNMRNTSLKQIRNEWRDSRFFLGKNKVMALALGKNPKSEYKKNLYQVSKAIAGTRGLFFTNAAQESVMKYFSEFKDENFARSGFVSSVEFQIPPGPVSLPFSMEPVLRKLGLPTKLKNGVIHLESKVTVCKVGDVLTPEQCKILEYFQQKLAVMRIRIHGVYTSESETYTDFGVQSHEEEKEEIKSLALLNDGETTGMLFDDNGQAVQIGGAQQGQEGAEGEEIVDEIGDVEGGVEAEGEEGEQMDEGKNEEKEGKKQGTKSKAKGKVKGKVKKGSKGKAEKGKAEKGKAEKGKAEEGLFEL